MSDVCFQIIHLNEVSHGQVNYPENRAIALGMFDGVHLGHVALIKRVLEYAKQHTLIPSVITFFDTPIKWLIPNKMIEMLSTLEERLSLLKEFGIQDVIAFNFPQIMQIKAIDYLNDIINSSLKAKFLISGQNHFFGEGGNGDVKMLQNWAITQDIVYEMIEPVLTTEGQIISSSLIRDLLKGSRIKEANRFLGHHYTIIGELIRGQSLGTKLNFPTLNIKYYTEKVALKFGVYAAIVELNGKSFLSATNYGIRPTVNCDNNKAILESHLLLSTSLNQIVDVSSIKENIKVKVSLLDFIREERKYNSIFELKTAIQKDCDEIRTRFSNYAL